MEQETHEVFAGDQQCRPAGKKGVVRGRPGTIDRLMNRIAAGGSVGFLTTGSSLSPEFSD